MSDNISEKNSSSTTLAPTDKGSDPKPAFWQAFKPKINTYSEKEIEDIAVINRLLRAPDDGKLVSTPLVQAFELIDPIYSRHSQDDLFLYWKKNFLYLSVSLDAAASLNSMVRFYFKLRPDIRPDPALVVEASMRIITSTYLRCVPFLMHAHGGRMPDFLIGFPMVLASGASNCASRMNVPQEMVTNPIADMIKEMVSIYGKSFKDIWQEEAAKPYYGETLTNYGLEWFNNTACEKRPNEVGFTRFVDYTVNALMIPNEIVKVIDKYPEWFKSARFRHFFDIFNPFASAFVLLHECVKNSCAWDWKKDVRVHEDIDTDVSWDFLAATFFGTFVPTVTTTTTTTKTDHSRWIRTKVLADSAKELHEKSIRMIHGILEEMKYCWK